MAGGWSCCVGVETDGNIERRFPQRLDSRLDVDLAHVSFPIVRKPKLTPLETVMTDTTPDFSVCLKEKGGQPVVRKEYDLEQIDAFLQDAYSIVRCKTLRTRYIY